MYSGLSYQLDRSFVENVPEKDSSSAIGLLVMMRTYSRNIYNDGKFIRTEGFKDIVERVVNGTFSILKDNNVNLDYDKHAREFFDLVYKFKITPPGRGFWAMGTELVHKHRMSMSLVNCTFVTTENIRETRHETFAYVMDTLMLGVGVGFDDEGAGKIMVGQPKAYLEESGTMTYGFFIDPTMVEESCRWETTPNPRKFLEYEHEYYLESNAAMIHTVQDSREGWVDALRLLLGSYLNDGFDVLFDYSDIREKGIPLKTFGGTSSGPLPLAEGLATIRLLLEREKGKPLSSLLICDICNVISTIVIAGNVRRSSQIFVSSNPDMVRFKDFNDPEMRYRTGWSWSSNNSLKVSEDYDIADIMEGIVLNGEPGIFNIELARQYGRIIDGKTGSDLLVQGVNPCGEICLEGKHSVGTTEKYSAGGETCNIVETYPYNFIGTLEEVVEEFEKKLWYAVLYCKSVTIIEPHWKSSKEIQNRNRRIGISQTGIQLFIAKYSLSLPEYGVILDRWYKKIREYDVEISAMLGIPQSIKLTTVKPSGTVTLCANMFSSGLHASPAPYFIRNVRISNEKREFITSLTDAGYKIEPDVYQPDTTSVISFPCKTDHGAITKRDLTVEYQYELLSVMQTYWADNMVSCTISFRDDEVEKIPILQEKYKGSIKGVSFLKINNGSYEQAPEIEINKKEYDNMSKNITPLRYSDFVVGHESEEEELDNYCTGEKCSRN